MARNPDDLPDASQFGLLVAELQQQRDELGDQVWKSAVQIRQAYGTTPGGRTWQEINEAGKEYMRNAPKDSVFIRIVQTDSVKDIPAIIRVKQGVVAGQVLTIEAKYTKPSGTTPQSLRYVIPQDLDADELAFAVAARINTSARFNAIAVGGLIFVQPELVDTMLELVSVDVQ